MVARGITLPHLDVGQNLGGRVHQRKAPQQLAVLRLRGHEAPGQQEMQAFRARCRIELHLRICRKLKHVGEWACDGWLRGALAP